MQMHGVAKPDLICEKLDVKDPVAVYEIAIPIAAPIAPPMIAPPTPHAISIFYLVNLQIKFTKANFIYRFF